MQLQNKTALITGAARGIGQAIARELAAAGTNLIGIDLTRDAMQETARIVQESGAHFHALACDVSDQDATQKMVEEATNINGGFDILINNAGVLPSGPFADQNFQVWRRTIEINLLGLMNLTHAALPTLLKRDSAHIVNIASIAGKFGTEGVVAYAASKHGVVGFSSGLRAELENTGVAVSWICPSPARTRLAENVTHSFLTPLVEPEDVARATRNAIEKNMIEVFVPGRVRLVVSILPSLMPGASRWLAKVAKASRGWTEARQKIQVK